MSGNKTLPTDVSVASYLDAVPDAARRADCEVLVEMMRRATGAPPVMWGTGIVGFGSYHYRYDSGREGDSCVLGFAARKGDISLYLMAGFEGQDALLARLGRHKTGKVCLYVRKLVDVELDVLDELLKGSVAAVQARYGSA
ncbi:DUF1801 domain-containing protein [Massilia niabensis]|uniref:DUF1801 domain-containing protein n=1 Tax=Massilia niabensis TaxID=544910 RepID=A0ABW0L8C7_9BURK